MGPSNSTSHMLPQIWQRINESHLRHRTTLEIIEEHMLSLNDHDEQMSAVNELQKRITFYHPGVPKVIYFRQSERDGACSVFGREYQVMMYTQYPGDCLQSVAQEKGERLYYSPCQCVQILNAISYLREHHGSFAVTPKMVFLGNRRQRISKVWIHSKIESSIPQFSVNEWEMCDSVCKLMHFMKSKRICVTINQQQIQTAASLRQFKELQHFITSVHKTKYSQKNMIVSRKKACSQFVPQTNRQQIKNFTQQTIDKLNSNHNNSVTINSCNRKHPKIQFIYQTTNLISTQSSLPHIENKQSHVKVQMPLIHFNKQSMQTQDNIYFSPNKDMNKPSKPVSFFNSPNSCPESITKQTNITERQIGLPLKEQEDKGTFSRLPTTSRSPKLIKEHNFHTIQEVPETERIFTNQDTRPWRKHKTVSLHSSANKFENYREAIKRYQEKMRQKFANSTGSNPLTAERKKDLVMPNAVVTPTQGEYKETESVYNNSEEEEPVARNSVSIEKSTQLSKKKYQQKLKNLFEKPDIDLASINSGQEGLSLHKGNDESSSIRDKIKQKKETFAQLKAEATKILQDLDH